MKFAQRFSKPPLWIMAKRILDFHIERFRFNVHHIQDVETGHHSAKVKEDRKNLFDPQMKILQHFSRFQIFKIVLGFSLSMDQISALLGKVCSWHVQTNGVQGQPRGVHGRSRFILILFEGSVSFRRRMRGFRGWRESFEFKEPQHYSWLYSDDPKDLKCLNKIFKMLLKYLWRGRGFQG